MLKKFQLTYDYTNRSRSVPKSHHRASFGVAPPSIDKRLYIQVKNAVAKSGLFPELGDSGLRQSSSYMRNSVSPYKCRSVTS